MVDPDLAWEPSRGWPPGQGRAVNPLTEEEPGGSSTRCASAESAGISSAAGTESTTVPRRRHAAVRHGPGQLQRVGEQAGRRRRPPPRRDRALEWIPLGDRTATDSGVRAGLRPGAGQTGLEGLLDRHPLRRRPLARAPIAMGRLQGDVYAPWWPVALRQKNG